MLDVKKLKVAELRDELKSRGLDTKGNKPALVKRLEKALKAEQGGEAQPNESFSESQDSSVLDTTGDEHEESVDLTDESPQKKEPVKESEAAEVEAVAVAQPTEQEEKSVAVEPDSTEEPEVDNASQKTNTRQITKPEDKVVEDLISADPEVSPPVEMVKTPEVEEVKVESTAVEPKAMVQEDIEPQDVKQDTEDKEKHFKGEEQSIDTAKEEPMEVTEASSESKPLEEDVKEEKSSEARCVEVKAEVKEEDSKEAEEGFIDAPTAYQVMDSVGETDDAQEKEASERKRKRSRSRSRDRQRSRRSRSPRRRRSRSYDRDRRSGSRDRHRYSSDRRERSRSREHSRHRDRSRSRDRNHYRDRSHERRRERERSRSPQNKSQRLINEDGWVTSTEVQWDRYNCDLNIRVSDDGYKCNPITVEGFAYMWAGARANFGFKSGKLAFECKVLENLNVNHLPEEETSRHVVRVGFSTESNSMQLGEEKLSYGYGGTGKASTECKFKDYGEKFTAGDVITAYVDFEGEKVEISFSKNETDLGVCYEIEKEDLCDKALFPHILTKNCELTVNFGQKDTPYFPLKEGFSFVSTVEASDSVRGELPPQNRSDCEVVMMVGLPGAGKTTWVNKYVEENKQKHYEVLGTNNIIDKMKVMGLPRKRNYAGRWDSLIDKSTKCLNRLLEIASKKKRNYIIDQTNVYFSARRRKMRSFEGFQRRAVVIIPEDEEFKNRCEKREKDEGKDVPDTAVWEMKANFKLPEVGEVFDKVEYVELGKEASEELVNKYNKEGEQNLPPDYWQNRYNRDHSRGGYSGGQGRYGCDRRDYNDRDRGNFRSRGGYGRYDNRDRDRRGGRGGWRGSQGSYYGYSSNDRQKSGSQDSYGNKDNYRKDYNNSNSYNSQSGDYSISGYDNSGGNQGNWPNQQGSWNNQGSWGNQQQGTWGNQQQGAWGNQTYNWSTGQWGAYNQQGQQGQQQQAAGQAAQQWGQGYNYYQYPQQQAWGNYNYSYQQPQLPDSK